MTYIGVKDPSLEIARGNIPGLTKVNKFGRTTNADAAVDTDIWDGANPTLDQPIWVAPTQARIHAIVSDNVKDDVGNTGANTLRLYGLADWDTAESFEDISLDGTTPVNTVGSYVIIHRMKVLTKGAEGVNLGTITATAATDATITAQINPQEGQTQMAIYGVPSTQTAFISRYYTALNKAVKTAGANVNLKANPEPENELLNYLVKHTVGVVSEGSNYASVDFSPKYTISGPAIIKLCVTSDTANCDVDGGFDIVLVDN